MAITSERITVTDAAAVLLSGAETDRSMGLSVLVVNRDATNSVDLGGADVVSGSGFELKASEQVSVDLESGAELYAIAAAAETAECHVLRNGV